MFSERFGHSNNEKTDREEMYTKKIKNCRLCYSKKLRMVIDFGNIMLSTIFPYKTSAYNKITPMILGVCKSCKAYQLLHNYNLNELYNKDYGFVFLEFNNIDNSKIILELVEL